MNAGGDEARDMRHVGEHRGADTIGGRTNPGEIDHARIGTRADDDHLRTTLGGEPIEFLVIDSLVVLANAVRDDRVQLTREVERVAVGQVSAVREVHAEHGVAGLEQRHVDRHVRLRA